MHLSIVQVLGIILVIFFYGLALYSIIKVIVIGLSFGRIAPFVPVSSDLIKAGLDLLEIKEGDNFIDVGSGDGRVVFEAAKSRGKSFTGIEIDSALCFWSNFSKLWRNRNSAIHFYKADATKYDYSDFNKAFFYLTPELIDLVIPLIVKEFPEGSVLVSAVFSLEKYREIYKRGNITSVEVMVGKKKKHIWVWKM